MVPLITCREESRSGATLTSVSSEIGRRTSPRKVCAPTEFQSKRTKWRRASTLVSCSPTDSSHVGLSVCKDGDGTRGVWHMVCAGSEPFVGTCSMHGDGGPGSPHKYARTGTGHPTTLGRFRHTWTGSPRERCTALVRGRPVGAPWVGRMYASSSRAAGRPIARRRVRSTGHSSPRPWPPSYSPRICALEAAQERREGARPSELEATLSTRRQRFEWHACTVATTSRGGKAGGGGSGSLRGSRLLAWAEPRRRCDSSRLQTSASSSLSGADRRGF